MFLWSNCIFFFPNLFRELFWRIYHIKNAKKGGYKVGKISIKNGDETIYKQAISITEDGAVKTKANSLGSELTESMDIHGGQVIGSSEVGTVRAKYDLAQEKGQLELINGDKQVAIAKYENKGGTATRGGFTYETVDDTISGQMYYNNHEVSFSGNTGELKSWGIRYQAEAKKQKEKIAPLVLEILRPLRERFNTAIDLFKYNGRTNFERFLSKDELAKCTEKLKGKAIDLESLKRTKDLPTEKMEYLRQIKSDIAQAEKKVSAGSVFAKRIEWVRKSHFNDFIKVARAYQRDAKLSNDTVLTRSKAKPPVIDGKLEDPFWKGLPEYKFRLANAPLPPRFKTEFKMGFRDDGKLYIGVHASDPDILSAKLVCKDRDTAVYDDDSMEKALRNITINQNGVILDYEKFGKINRKWNTSGTVKVFRGKNFYSIEMAIPLKEIGIDPDSVNPILRMNICRNKRSGVSQNYEQSCWIPVYGNFHNVMHLPAIRLVGNGDAALEDFSSINKTFLNRVVTIKGKQKTVKNHRRMNLKNGELLVFLTYLKGENSYGDLNLTGLSNVTLGKARTIEIRFKSPDSSLTHMACWSYIGTDGKTHSDWIRFSAKEVHSTFSIRTFDIARDGYNATQRKIKKLPPFEPVKLTYFAIYTHCNKHDGTERSYTLDYVRVTEHPASAEKK